VRDRHDLELLLRSSIPIVVIESHEEPRVVELMRTLRLEPPRAMFHWTITRGLLRLAEGYQAQAHAREPREALSQIKMTRAPGIYVLSDFHPYLGDPVHVRLIKDIALNHTEVPHTLVLLSHAVELPPELEAHAARFELSMPDRDALQALVVAEAKAWAARNPGRHVRTSEETLGRLVDNLLGMPRPDARRLARRAIEDDGAISSDDLPDVMRAKFELLGRDGVLGFEHDTARFAEVGGLSSLKGWLAQREPVFSGALARPGLDVPKGVLLLGVQGCGKSLAAKAVAGAWNVPLLRLDFGTLYNKYYGETERNLRDSLRQAELMAPCVLWIDEIEKGVSTDSSDSGTSRRILGTLLTWMAENRQRVFIVATANDIESLPPELLRKGRLDEIFFVDLPDAGTRRVIAEIHLRKRDIDAERIDLDAVVDACEGFSGAEIEQAVVAALYAAHAGTRQLDTGVLVDEMRRTRPLSVVMAERIAWLRAWAAERTVPAN
jgi:hypothetical protein